MTDRHPDLHRAIDLIRKAQYPIALTGAGISTPSGIPDFRSSQSGLWENANILEVATIYGFKTNPKRFYDWVKPLVATIANAQPNPAHVALRRLERLGKLKAVITQNIDMLHTAAGSQEVYEVHGSLKTMTCMRCYQTYEARGFLEPLMAQDQMPMCQCGGVLKPNVILFGEQLPVLAMQNAEQAVKRCDLILVAGSSLEVAPVGDFPLKAKKHDAMFILVNFTPTSIDRAADVVIHDDVATILPLIADALEAENAPTTELN